MPKTTTSIRELGCLAPAVGIAGLVATLMLGPIDLGRSVYNQIIGDTPILKRESLDYSRRGIQKKDLQYTPQQVETLSHHPYRWNWFNFPFLWGRARPHTAFCITGDQEDLDDATRT